jgi:UDP-N-acetylglucosamine--N-acetylmuramyl-(pentapeptide) pyrophosphoryl-undecaprenol N-acetylglucosamine transferase
VRISGNPVRRAFLEAARRAAADPAGFEARARCVLVIGGSQGARAINEQVPAALAAAGLGSRSLTVLHQTGPAMRDEVEARYRELGLSAEVTAFIDDMPAAYASAALVIARAGATTVAELAAVGRPSILIPFPLAADDHQRDNAEALERAGAAITIAQSDLEGDRLSNEVTSLLSDTARRTAMAEAARRAGRPEAAAAIVDDLTAWLGGPTEASHAGSGSGETAKPGDGNDPGGTVRRSSVPGRVPYVPSLGTTSAAGAPEAAPRPVLVVGWEA